MDTLVLLASDCILDCNPVLELPYTELPTSLCPCEPEIVVEPDIVEQISLHCLDSYLFNLVVVKNCSTMPTGCN